MKGTGRNRSFLDFSLLLSLHQGKERKRIIFDLDNTVYSVHSIGEELFASLFELILEDGSHTQYIDEIKNEIMRKPFQLVAREYHFSEQLTLKGVALLKDLEYRGKIAPFD